MKKEPRTFTFWDSVKSRLSRIGYNIRLIGDLISGTFSLKYEPEAFASAEKRRNKALLIIVAVTILSLLLILGIPWLRYYDQIVKLNISNSDGFLFIGSFWGAILGSIFAGIATVITTWMIINRSYRIDFHRDRIDHLPILSIREIRGAIYEKDIIIFPNGTIVSEERNYQEVFAPCKNGFQEILEVTNVGANVALNVSTKGFTDEHNEAYFSGITTKDIVYIIFFTSPDVDSKKITLEFWDIFGNKYEQSFTYKINQTQNLIFVGGSVPTLIERTQRIRYTQ